MSENSVPSGALGLSIVVICYSATCLFLSLLLFFLLYRQHDELTYVSLVALGTSVGSLASVIQQIHYAVDFRSIKVAQEAAAVFQRPGAVVTGGSIGVDLVLFWFQFYSYNVNALLILFWSIQLFKNTWRLKSKSVWWTEKCIETSCKLFAILFPAVLFGIVQIDAIQDHFLLFELMVNVILGISLVGGSVFLALTLYRFVEARRSFNCSSQDFASSGSSHGATATVTAGTMQSDPQNLSYKRKNDRWLIIRFTIAFFILSMFEIAVIMFQVVAYNRNNKAKTTSKIDLSPSNAMGEILQFIPGVTASLVAFLVWGTTTTFRQDMILLFSCSSRRKLPSTPPRLPSQMHKHKPSLTAKLRAAGHSRSPSEFERLEDGAEGMVSLKNIQVTTELCVSREEARVDVRDAKGGGGGGDFDDRDVIGPWTRKEDFDLMGDATKIPARSKSKLGLHRSDTRNFDLPPIV